MLPEKQYSRSEQFLNAIATGDDTNLPKPQSRSEKLLKAIIDGDLSDLEKPQSRMELYLDHIARNGGIGSKKKYGVKMNKKSSSPTLERLGDAIGLEAAVGLDEQRIKNDFDYIYPWSHRRLCNLDANGKVLAYEGEPGFKRDGSNGNVMVETPKFYQMEIETDDFIEFWISETKQPGFRLSPAFTKADGTELDAIYVGAYEAGYDGSSKLTSQSGVFPAVNMNRQVARNRARAIGSGWGITDIAYRCDILFFLFIIEFATLNAQSLMNGQCNFSMKKSVLAENNVNRIVMTNSDATQYVVGQTVWVAGSNRRITAINTHDASNKELIIDGAPFNTTVDMDVDMRGWITGTTDNVKAKSGSTVSHTDGKHCFKYRGEENIYGDIWEWVDGCNIKDHQAWVHFNPEEYADDLFGAPYKQLGYVNSKSNGYTKVMGYDESLPYAKLPIDTTGSSSTYYSDYYYQNTGNRAPVVGGSWGGGTHCGLVYWYCVGAFTNSNASIGARLSYKTL